MSPEEREARHMAMNVYKPLVQREEQSGARNPLSWSDRRQQVDDYTELTAAKQFRLRQISDHHLHRKRPFISTLDNILDDEPALAPNADASAIHDHILAILGIQNGEGAFFNSLSQEQQRVIQNALQENTEGNFLI